jgi:hypothetical protein
MNKRIYFILEVFWLILAIFGLFAGFSLTLRQGLKESWLFFLIALISFAMYFMRKNLRKKGSK